MIETLRERQLEREQLQLEEGILRYSKGRERKSETDMSPGNALVDRAVEPVMRAIEEMVAKVEAGKAGRGRPAIAASYLKHLMPGPVAYLTARVCIDAAAKMEGQTAAAMRLSALIEEHYQFDELCEETPALGNSLERKAKKHTSGSHRRFIMRIGVKATAVRGLEWKQGDKLFLGQKLIELFIERTGLIEQEMTREGKNNTKYRLRTTPATTEWLANQHSKLALLRPRFMPMVCPPKPWTSPVSGGYLTRENRTDFIGRIGAEARDDVFSVEMGDVYRAVNSVQATAWRINRPVYDVLAACLDSNATLGGLPPSEDMPIPARPDDIPRDLSPEEMGEDMKARLKEWRHAATKAHEANAQLISKRLAVKMQRTLAEDVLDEERIYFPHNVDFRGRLYSLVPGLHPQTDDAGKSLIEFAEGKPLGENGGYWLAVHIANLFGVDKVSFDERVEWTMSNEAKIFDSAFNPLDGHRFWCEADDPWCALAACFEWAGFRSTDSSYVSHLPIAMDGSCSGIQHFSAMLRDAEGGKAVNLTPTDTPADIYTEVAKTVEVYLNDPGVATDQLAQAWRGKVTRKIVKRPCMTFAYSVTSRGIMAQLLDELHKQALGGQYLPGYENWEAANYLGPLVELAIRSTVDRASEAMDWLQDTTRRYIEGVLAEVKGTDQQGKAPPINWFTPDGFPVQQAYRKSNGKRFKVWFLGKRMDVQLRVPTEKPDLRKHTSAVAPNFVHSLDACHLRMVVNRMYDEGITSSFAMIHDSFGVHACDIDELHFAIRDEFILLYQENQLARFREMMQYCLPTQDFLPVPEEGELDLEDVRVADFFFS